ncbi:phenylalanine--tRNA ligase subunit beta, partial [Patescibacteria group bacterium]|nr:phenylalanine--tRNA ligase subunit beta [Patescibacteria group bacterium]
SNRVDAMGMVGLAREAAAILNKKFLWKPVSGKKFPISNFQFPIKISVKKLCPRYMAARIDGVKVESSPWWLKRRLLSAGLHPINNIVDITNFILLELAQPMHAFDADALDGGIDVRLARRNEKILALDGKEYALDDEALVIADAKEPVAIAGIMGGEKTGVTGKTASIILEAATFDPVSVRRTSRRLNIQSDSQLRFEKGLSPEAPPFALARAVELVLELAGGKLAGAPSDARAEKTKPAVFSITVDEVNSLIGVNLPQKTMVDILRRLGFEVSTKGKMMKAAVPWWRDHDIESGRDLVEEIARVYGYGKIPAIIPFGLATRPLASLLLWEDRLREISKGAGCIETYSYSFVSKDLLDKAGYDSAGMLHVLNPLSEDLAVMRTTLLPSLLQTASENREREPVLRLFEIANVYYPPTSRLSGTGPKDKRWKDLPDERSELGALFMGMGDSWKVAKGYVEHLLHEMGIEKVSWRRLANDEFWHPGRTVQAFVDGGLVATVGEVSPKIAANFKLEQRVALVDMPLLSVVRHAVLKKRYVPVPLFPPAKRDLAVIVDSHVEFDDMAEAMKKADGLIKTVEWFDTYSGKNLPDGKKSVAMHLEFSSPEKTLESKEVDSAMENAVLALKEKFKAEVRG